jgi:tetratricopeptide (TPR) repeat protein
MGPCFRRDDVDHTLRYNQLGMNNLQHRLKSLVQSVAVAALLSAAPPAVRATGAEPATDPQPDPAPCVEAAAANDADKIIAVCGALADNEKTMKADRIKALIARGAAYGARDQIDHAIGDYDTALRLDATLADIFNARGELWRRKGDQPRALADFDAAIKLNPRHAAARANYKSLALELERIGAEMAIKNKPELRSGAPSKPSPPLK